MKQYKFDTDDDVDRAMFRAALDAIDLETSDYVEIRLYDEPGPEAGGVDEESNPNSGETNERPDDDGGDVSEDTAHRPFAGPNSSMHEVLTVLRNSEMKSRDVREKLKAYKTASGPLSRLNDLRMVEKVGSIPYSYRLTDKGYQKLNEIGPHESHERGLNEGTQFHRVLESFERLGTSDALEIYEQQPETFGELSNVTAAVSKAHSACYLNRVDSSSRPYEYELTEYGKRRLDGVES